MILLIDDQRNLGADVIARGFGSGKRMLELGGWEELWLDHDLGFCPSGYELIKAVDPSLIPPRVVLVTSNPVGRDNIGAYLVSVGFKKNSPTLFTRL